jgi:hypothetical protein
MRLHVATSTIGLRSDASSIMLVRPTKTSISQKENIGRTAGPRRRRHTALVATYADNHLCGSQGNPSEDHILKRFEVSAPNKILRSKTTGGLAVPVVAVADHQYGLRRNAEMCGQMR